MPCENFATSGERDGGSDGSAIPQDTGSNSLFRRHADGSFQGRFIRRKKFPADILFPARVIKTCCLTAPAPLTSAVFPDQPVNAGSGIREIVSGESASPDAETLSVGESTIKKEKKEGKKKKKKRKKRNRLRLSGFPPLLRLSHERRRRRRSRLCGDDHCGATSVTS